MAFTSNGGPLQTLLKIKSMHKFFFPCFAWGFHYVNWLLEAIEYILGLFRLNLFPGLLNPLQTSSLTKLSKHLQATGKQPVHVEGYLIVRAGLPFRMRGLSRLISLKPCKLRHPWSQSGIPGRLLLLIWSLQSTAYLKPFLRNFFVYEKHVRYTPGSTAHPKTQAMQTADCRLCRPHRLSTFFLTLDSLFFGFKVTKIVFDMS